MEFYSTSPLSKQFKAPPGIRSWRGTRRFRNVTRSTDAKDHHTHSRGHAHGASEASECRGSLFRSPVSRLRAARPIEEEKGEERKEKKAGEESGGREEGEIELAGKRSRRVRDDALLGLIQ